MSAALVISLISLLVSAGTLYLVHFRKPSLSCLVGPEIKVYYTDYEFGSSLGLIVPITFINSAARTGSIINVAVSILRADTPQQQFLMLWREFHKLDIEKNQWIYSESAHAIAIPGNSAVNKMIWFLWGSDSHPKLVLTKGAYKLRVHFWKSKRTNPTTTEHDFVIGDAEYDSLEQYRRNKQNSTIGIWLDKELEQNRSMTVDEAKRLLGVSK